MAVSLSWGAGVSALRGTERSDGLEYHFKAFVWLSDPETPKSPESQHQAALNFIDVTEPWPREMREDFMGGFFNS